MKFQAYVVKTARKPVANTLAVFFYDFHRVRIKELEQRVVTIKRRRMALLSTSFRTEIAYLTSACSDFQGIRLVKANLDILIIRDVPLLDDVTIRNNRIIA